MMSVKISPWDSSEYLKTEEDVVAYLEAVMEGGGDDPAFVVRALGTIVRARSMSQLAREAGVSREALYGAFSGERVPASDTVERIARALGLDVRFQAGT